MVGHAEEIAAQHHLTIFRHIYGSFVKRDCQRLSTHKTLRDCQLMIMPQAEARNVRRAD